jgi:small subunit ribosomal protein S20
MANSKSALKRILQNEIRRDRNRSARTAMRTSIKGVRRALDLGEIDKAVELLPVAIKTIDVTARKRVIHRNTADRTKSRLVRAVAAAKASASA